MTKIRCTALAFLIATGAVLAGCSGTPQAPVTVTVEASAPAATATEESAAASTPSQEAPAPVLEEVSEPAPEETFTMPALVGMNLQLAQDTLQALDSYVLVQDDAAGLGRFQVLDANWQVCTQDPAPGDVMPISTLVTLGAVKLDETC